VLAFQLAHIVLGHHIDTKYAFNDRLLFPDEATFERIHMQHTDGDDEAAAKKAITLIEGLQGYQGMDKNMERDAGLYLTQLQARSKELVALNTPRLGDGLLKPDGSPWMATLLTKAGKLDMDKLDQIAALPLGSRLRLDAWDDKVYQLNAKVPPILNARDKMPFEVTPVYFKLTRFDQAQTTAGAAPASAPATPDAGATPPNQAANTQAPQQ
jgi:hypothetical protein